MDFLLRLSYLLLIVWNKSVANASVISNVKKSYLTVPPGIDNIQINYKNRNEIIFPTDLEARLSSIEAQLKNLIYLIRGQERSTGSCADALPVLVNQHSSLDSQRKTEQITIDEQLSMEEEKNNNLNKTQQITIHEQLSIEEEKNNNLNNIIQLIKSNEFENAKEELIAMGENADIHSLVIKAYSGSETNFESIIRFAEALSNTSYSYSFQIFKALANEMQVNDLDDPVKLVELAKALRTKVLIQELDPSDGIKTDAEVFIKGLHHNITNIATKYFSRAMIEGDYYTSHIFVQLLAEAIDDYDTIVSDDVMEALVNATYNRIESSQILNNIIVSHSRINQSIMGIIALFGKIKNDGQLNNSAVLDIAFHLSKLRKRSSYGEISLEKKLAVEKVLEDIPTCARSLFFEQSVCLWNKKRQAYLYAADSTANYDKDSRRILVSSASDNVATSGASWFVEKIKNKILLKSVKYVNEYLHAVAIDYAPSVHYVFNWITGNNTDAQSEWIIELRGDYCTIKSAYFNEYLYASQSKFMDSFYAFTTNSDNLIVDYWSAWWQIRGC